MWKPNPRMCSTFRFLGCRTSRFNDTHVPSAIFSSLIMSKCESASLRKNHARCDIPSNSYCADFSCVTKYYDYTYELFVTSPPYHHWSSVPRRVSSARRNVSQFDEGLVHTNPADTLPKQRPVLFGEICEGSVIMWEGQSCEVTSPDR